MGIQAGSISLSRYRLIYDSGSPSRAGGATLKALSDLLEPQKAGLLDLQPKGVIPDVQIGWVRPSGVDLDGLAEDDHWDMGDCRLEDSFLLRLRMEKRRVPGTLLTLMLKQKIAQITEAEGKPPRAKDKRQMRVDMQRDLMKKSLPQVSFVDGLWNEKRRDLTIYSTSKAAKENFLELFHRTFGEKLGILALPVEPPLLSLPDEEWTAGQLDKGQLGKISLAAPATFLAN